MPGTCSQEQRLQEGDEANEAMDEDDDDQPFTRKPFTRTMQKQERDALQKWVQCAKCAKWRKVRQCLSSCVLLTSAFLLCAAPSLLPHPCTLWPKLL